MKIRTQIFFVIIVCFGGCPFALGAENALLPGQTQLTANSFNNHSLGIHLIKPDLWHFISAEQITDNFFREIKLKDENLFKLISQKYKESHLVAIMKYQEPYDGINPSFKINIMPFDPSKGKDIKTVLQYLTAGKKYFKQFQVVDGPHDTLVAGLEAAQTDSRATLPSPSLLRTVLESFPSYGSSIPKGHSCGAARLQQYSITTFAIRACGL